MTGDSNLDGTLKSIENSLFSASAENRIQAHQFTINGITYPFVRELGFAAVPDPPRRRRYDMYASLYLTKPGDLLFFFQSDPQWDDRNVESRRGLRGVYRVVSRPFRDEKMITHEGTGYSMRGVCRECGTFHSTLSQKCPMCGTGYPLSKTIVPSTGEGYPELVLASRIEIEPVIVFERATSDQRVYGDMSDPGMVWIGRHDNAMGAGKGASIRQLLPEEAMKIVRLLAKEPDQRITFDRKREYPNPASRMTNDDGTPIGWLALKSNEELANEDMLNFSFSMTAFDRNAPISRLIANWMPHGWDAPEYASSMFPWGYTSGTADFVTAFKEDDYRRRVMIFEFKKGRIDDEAALQVSVYVPWVVQVLAMFCRNPPKEMTVMPVVVASDVRGGFALACPEAYSYDAVFNSGAKLTVSVDQVRFVAYKPAKIQDKAGTQYAVDLSYEDRSHELTSIEWVPPAGTSGTAAERYWLRHGSWNRAREGAQLKRW